MDDDYELVSKDVIRQLREENRKLKNGEIEGGGSGAKVDSAELGKQLVEMIKSEFAAENQLILDNLTEIKDLNKSTLENLIAKTESLDARLEKMIEGMGSMVDSLTEVLDDMGDKDDSALVIVKDKVEQVTTNMEKFEKDLGSKMDEIELFMKNLRILLSYVKPADIVIEKPTNGGMNVNSNMNSGNNMGMGVSGNFNNN